MEDIVLALRLVSIELGVLIVALLVYLILMFSRRYRAHRRSARNLVTRLKSSRDTRQQRRRDLLKQINVMSEDLIEEGLNDLIGRENTLFRRILNALTGDNADGLDNLDEDIHGLVAGYLALVADGVNHGSRGRDELLIKLRTEINNISAQYRELKQENVSLKAELEKVTGEYNRIYEREQLRLEQQKGPA